MGHAVPILSSLAGGYAVIGFLTDNPGFWFLHCHILPYLEFGMGAVINELESNQTPPPVGKATMRRLHLGRRGIRR